MIAGWITFEVIDGELCIFTVHVNDRWRRRGIATELLRQALQTPHEKVRAMVLQGEDNKESIRLFEKIGFSKTLTDEGVFMVKKY